MRFKGDYVNFFFVYWKVSERSQGYIHTTIDSSSNMTSMHTELSCVSHSHFTLESLRMKCWFIRQSTKEKIFNEQLIFGVVQMQCIQSTSKAKTLYSLECIVFAKIPKKTNKLSLNIGSLVITIMSVDIKFQHRPPHIHIAHVRYD